MALHLNNIEYSLSKDDLCQFWLKLVQFLWRRFVNVVNVFLLFYYYLPFEKGCANLNPLHLRMLCAKFGQNWFNGSREEMTKNEKVYNEDSNNDRQWTISLEPLAPC